MTPKKIANINPKPLLRDAARELDDYANHFMKYIDNLCCRFIIIVYTLAEIDAILMNPNMHKLHYRPSEI